MKRLLLILAFLLIPNIAQAQYTKLFGFCEDGNQSVVTGGLTSTTKVQRSFPSCTVTVYDHGTTNVSTIYSDATGTSKGNPFTAAADGQWAFYATPTQRYDITFSGVSSGIATPFTINDQSPPPGFSLATLNAQNFSGADTLAKINSAITSGQCSTACTIIDGKLLGSSETSCTPILNSSAAINFILNGLYTCTGQAAVSGGWPFQFSGINASGSTIGCGQAFPQNLAYLKLGNAMPCGFIYAPTTSGVGAVITDSTGGINGIKIHDISFVANSNVTDIVQYAAVGYGMGSMVQDNVGYAAFSTSQSWSGYMSRLVCSGVLTGAQYGYFDFKNVTGVGNGSAVNSGLGGTTSGGIRMDPTGCTQATYGPSTVENLVEEGLTGTYGFKCLGCEWIDIIHPIINSNNFAANGRGIECSNVANVGACRVINPQMSDNDWSGNGGVDDISFPAGTGSQVVGGNLNGGSASASHAEAVGVAWGASALGGVEEGVSISNMGSFGTTVSAGAVGIRYAGNTFSAGNGSSTEFQTWSPLPNHGSAIMSAGTDNILRLHNMSFGALGWNLDADSNGAFDFFLGTTLAANFDSNRNLFLYRQLAYNTFTMTHTMGGTDTPVLAANGGTSVAGAFQMDIVNDTSGFTIANPTGVVAGSLWILMIENTSGGSLGTITWGASYRGTASFTAPANNKARFVFLWNDGTRNWFLFTSQADL